MNAGTKYSKGDIVIIQFPFSDLIQSKKRPMVVIGEYKQDIIGCAITSNPESEGIPINEFEEGNLPLKSKIKYWQIATFLKGVIIKKAARISRETHQELVSKISEILKTQPKII